MKKLVIENLTIDPNSPVTHEGFVYAQLNEHITALTIATGNNLLTFFSRHYKRLYDVGIVEWRVMTLLAIQPNIRLVTICEMLMSDKAGVSRALSRLQEKRLVATKDNEWNTRSKFWQLTPAGAALHGVIVKENNRVSEAMIAGISAEHIVLLHSTFQKLNSNIEQCSKLS